MEAHSLDRQSAKTYAALTRRIHAAVHSRLAQAEHQVIIRREPHESQADWDRLMEEIRDAEVVTVTPRPDGSAHLAWYVENEL
ncbi:DUF1654 domain-containing protein [Metapseudomonas lalkuanensis]|uniref:DUF1654 domain-containing protein n=1 Tax=Metapseudomonas lalkuanensis TaxID=2604832 RepID=UPI001CF29CE9|nr:DUF1654 domain-containing protein [Pseudomonas lalkuanensis]UCP00072.1 DUF1654 domain-containing protein [Pseudomonas lalkuanensis]